MLGVPVSWKPMSSIRSASSKTRQFTSCQGCQQEQPASLRTLGVNKLDFPGRMNFLESIDVVIEGYSWGCRGCIYIYICHSYIFFCGHITFTVIKVAGIWHSDDATRLNLMEAPILSLSPTVKRNRQLPTTAGYGKMPAWKKKCKYIDTSTSTNGSKSTMIIYWINLSFWA